MNHNHSFMIIFKDRPGNSKAVSRLVANTPPGTRLICLTPSPEVCSDFGRKGVCCIGLASDEREPFPEAYAVLILSEMQLDKMNRLQAGVLFPDGEISPGIDPDWIILQGCHFYGIPCTIREGNGLRIRESTAGDAAVLLPGLKKEGLSVSVQDWESYTENAYRIQGYGMWTVETKSGTRQNKTGSSTYTAAGWCGLHPGELPEGGTELGYYILPQFRGLGIAGEACRMICSYAGDSLGIERLLLRIRKENRSSRNLAEKLLFQEMKETAEEILYCKDLSRSG